MTKLNATRRQFLRTASVVSGSVGTAAAPFALNMATLGAAVGQTTPGYKAIVCMFFYGGCDSSHMVLRTDAASFNEYTRLRNQGMIQAYGEGFGFQGYIFRFVSILGERYTHGHVFDFYKKLSDDPTRLHVLGNGKQRKSYLYVHDCIDAMLLAIRVLNNKVHVLNLGTDEASRVNDSIGWISERLGLRPALTYSGGERGWIGDSPFIFLDTARVRSLGWKPSERFSSLTPGVLW